MFFGEGVLVVARDAVDVEIELAGEADVAVVGTGDVGWVKRDDFAVNVGDRCRDAKGKDGGDSTVEVDDGLVETGDLRFGLGVEAVGAGVGAEVEVEGAVFLEENEDVLDVLAEEFELDCG